MVINYPVCKSEFLKRKPWHSSLLIYGIMKKIQKIYCLGINGKNSLNQS